MPGLLEKIYETCLVHELKEEGYEVRRKISLPIQYDGLTFQEGLRIDVLVEELVIAEIRAVNEVNAVWQAQILSHLKLTNLRLGYVINFNVPQIKSGIKRLIV